MSLTEQKQSCMALDKWGEHNCLRSKGHELNRADHRRRQHWMYVNGIKYVWFGHKEAKQEK